MPKFAANLTMMYRELPFLARFAAAAADGFTAVEYLFPYDYPASELAARLSDHGLVQAMFNAPPGDWDSGDRGTAALPGREAEFRCAVEKALAYADVLGNDRIHVMAGLVHEASNFEKSRETYLDNLSVAARLAAECGKTILIEPINQRDMPTYFLSRQADARHICETLALDNIKIQFDAYHCQIVEGDLTVNLRAQAPYLGHVQIAGVPDRHEPDQGEVNYPHFFSVLDAIAYEGWVGCEYIPRAGTSAGLSWMRGGRSA